MENRPQNKREHMKSNRPMNQIERIKKIEKKLSNAKLK